jgi:hypothetical protein
MFIEINVPFSMSSLALSSGRVPFPNVSCPSLTQNGSSFGSGFGLGFGSGFILAPAPL